MNRILPLLLLAPTAVLAHPGHDHHHHDASPFLSGLNHPIGGADHVLAMVAVGLWAATALDRRAIWALPLTFVAAMVVGGLLGTAGIQLPGVEPAILASSIILGVIVALALQPSLAVALPVVAAFGIMHGHAHGIEGPATGLAAYAAGFVLATTALHLVGIGLGRFGVNATRVMGGVTAVAGVALLVMP